MAEHRIHLRKASESDIRLLGELADKSWWEHYPDVISEEQIRYMLDWIYSEPALAKQMQDGQDFWLVSVDGEPIGFVGISEKSPQSFFIHKFYLLQKVQGMGVGRKAFEHLLNEYPNAKEIRLNVNRQNFKSINFYFRIGFKIEKCVDIPIGEGYVMDDFVMVRK